jgi:hypothetical protein
MKANIFKGAIAALVLAAGTQASAQTEIMHIYRDGVPVIRREVTQIDSVVFGPPVQFSVNKTNIRATVAAASDSIVVTSNSAWSATVSSPGNTWVTISPSSGGGNGTITVSIAENENESSRYATINIVSIRGGTSYVSVSQAAVPPARKASWLFDDPADLFKAAIGQALVPGQGGKNGAGEVVPLLVPTTALGNFTAVAGPKAGDGALRVNRGYFLQATHGIAPNGGGTMVNEYTIMWRVKFVDAHKWTGLLQTDPANSNDADVFVNTDGGLGQSWSGRTEPDVIMDNVWHTIVFSMKCGEGGFGRYYCDGIYLRTNSGEGWIDGGSVQTIDGNRALDVVCLFLADNDGEDPNMADGYIEVAEIAIWDIALTNAQVLGLEE